MLIKGVVERTVLFCNIAVLGLVQPIQKPGQSPHSTKNITLRSFTFENNATGYKTYFLVW